jgi:hypothetical protein
MQEEYFIHHFLQKWDEMKMRSPEADSQAPLQCLNQDVLSP